MYQIRFVLYAEAHGRSPDEQLAADKARWADDRLHSLDR